MLDLSCLKKDAISQIYARALVNYRNPNRFFNDLDLVHIVSQNILYLDPGLKGSKYLKDCP